MSNELYFQCMGALASRHVTLLLEGPDDGGEGAVGVPARRPLAPQPADAVPAGKSRKRKDTSVGVDWQRDAVSACGGSTEAGLEVRPCCTHTLAWAVE